MKPITQPAALRKANRKLIDIHNHILNGIDDGASNLEESIAMANIASMDGIDVIVTTPHDRDVLDRHSIDKLVTIKETLELSLKQHNVPLKLIIGMENHMELNLIERVKHGRSLPIEGTNYILVELPFDFYPYYTNEVLNSIQNMGLLPIIVHPERNVAIQTDISLVHSLIRAGFFIQVDSGSIEGSFGNLSAITSKNLLKHRLVDFIATDAHSSQGTRIPIISRSVDIAATLIGDNEAQNLVNRNPQMLLSNESVPSPYK